ncbi:MAG: ABC transporter ATP-binding protein, partial [Anaerolineae bacterium]|nr:ABC transporter ATP-binding protein [Anaerolineae bacterium]
LHPSERDIAFVFQLFALYPHMTAYENIAFPLQAEGASKGAITQRVKEVVDLLQIHHLLDLRPRKLSGGDLQRIALARALVRRPAAFLMDEPLGALDTDFRETMRAEIKKLHINQNATTVYVTHDQIEAMAMGDRIVVMSAAVVQQVGTPDEVYYDPANLFVARFIGSPGMNLIKARYADGAVRLPGERRYSLPAAWRPLLEQNIGAGGEVVIGFRPEAAQIQSDGAIAGEVYASELYGAYTMLHISLGGDEPVIHIRSDRLIRYDLGSQVQFNIDPTMVRFFDPTTEQAITP